MSVHLTRIGVDDPDQVASRIALIINGAYVSGSTSRPADLTSDLLGAAMTMVRARS